MNYENNEIIKVTETLMRSLNDIEFKTNQINQLKKFVDEHKSTFLSNANPDLNDSEKVAALQNIESDISKLNDLVQGHAIKLKNICAQYDLEIAYEVASTLNKWLK